MIPLMTVKISRSLLGSSCWWLAQVFLKIAPANRWTWHVPWSKALSRKNMKKQHIWGWPWMQFHRGFMAWEHHHFSGWGATDRRCRGPGQRWPEGLTWKRRIPPSQKWFREPGEPWTTYPGWFLYEIGTYTTWLYLGIMYDFKAYAWQPGVGQCNLHFSPQSFAICAILCYMTEYTSW